MAATDEERREVASVLRSCWGGWSSADCYYAIIHTLGVPDTYLEEGWRALYSVLADLIDPTCEARRDTVFKPAVLYPDIESDDVGYEETVYRCGRCGEIVSFDVDYNPETDLPAYCERCGSRITGIGEPWDE